MIPVKTRMKTYASVIRWAFGECGEGGRRPVAAAATPPRASAPRNATPKARPLRRTPGGIVLTRGEPPPREPFAGRPAAARAAALRGLRERRAADGGERLPGRRVDARLPAPARARGETRLLAVAFDASRRRGHVPQARGGQRRVRLRGD